MARVVVSEVGGAAINGTSSYVCDGCNVNVVAAASADGSDPDNDLVKVAVP